MKLGDLLKTYRSRNKITMKEFADSCGFSKAYVGMLEKGINPTTGKPVSPTVQTLEKIAKGMGRDLDSLLKALDEDQPVTISRVKPLDSEEIKLVDNYREMNAEDKDFLWDIVRRLLNRKSTVAAVNPAQNNYNNSGEIKNNFVAYGGHNSVKQNVTMN